MSVSVGLNSRLLSQGQRYYAYSGIVTGDVSVPASITLLNFESGLRDSFIKIQPNYGVPVSTAVGSGIGISVKIDGEEVVKSQKILQDGNQNTSVVWEFFVPKQSNVEVISLNTSANNTQERGVTLLGWYL